MKNKMVIVIISLLVLFVSFYSIYIIGVNEITKNNTNNSNVIKITDKNTDEIKELKSKIELSLDKTDNNTIGLKKIKVYITNNSNRDIKYIEVNLCEKSEGKIVKSEWTNYGYINGSVNNAIIRVGEEQTIDTYFTFQELVSTLEVELSKVTFY